MLKMAVDPALPESFIASQLTKLVESVNLDARLNLRPEQITTIAEDLVDAFPVESLEDFVLCFRRAIMGMYGVIYKIDMSVICTWMAAYLEDKYLYVEQKHNNVKDDGIKNDEVNYEAFKKRMSEDKESTWVTDSDFEEFQKNIDRLMKK